LRCEGFGGGDLSVELDAPLFCFIDSSIQVREAL
jgi:hypothetical protein